MTGKPSPAVPTSLAEALAAVGETYLTDDVRELFHVGPETLAEFRDPAKAERYRGPRAEGVEVREEPVPGTPGVRALVYTPVALAMPAPALLWLHGGGMVGGSAAGVDDVASRFAADLGCVVVVPDYRLAPEHPYPAAIDDCFAALAWMADGLDGVVDPARLVVGGDSAGGGLAASVAQRAHDEGVPLRLQVLMAPMLDDRTVPRSERMGRVAIVWTVPSNRFGWQSYLGHEPGQDETRPYAVPARREDLTGLAPAWLSVGGADLFLDEAVAYAERLRAAGVPVELVTVPGAHHGSEATTPDHPEVLRLQAKRRAAIRAAFDA